MGKPRNKNKNKSTKVVRKGDKEAADAAAAVALAEEEEKRAYVPSADQVVAGGEYRSATGVLNSQPTSRDVKIGSFTLIAHSRLLIDDTDLEFTIGRRYGLLGNNGCGKSTFLKCLAAREVPIPDHIDIFLLESEAPPEEVTAIDAVVRDAERKMETLERRAEALIEAHGPDSELVMDCYERLEDMDPSTFRKRAGELLCGLGFGPEMMRKNTCDMSGGWRMRVALAQALFARPTLLLLDEPTNHLDLEAVVWLEDYLSKYDRCLVVVSHSQDFLNACTTNIMEITEKKQLDYYSGNYDTYVRTKQELLINQEKRYKKQEDDIKHLKNFISSCGTYSNLVRQAKSKQKILDKMEADGLIEKPMPPTRFQFRFPETKPLPPPLISFEGVGFSYSGAKEDYLYSGLDLAIPPDARITLVGPNGAGKSTLLKLMVNDLQPCEGQIRRHLDTVFARYHQHSNELLPPDVSPLDYLKLEYKDMRREEDEWRKHLGRYGVTGPMQVMEMSKLSDGMKSRMVFALMALQNPNVLVLDEPTNCLDIPSIDALADAISAFAGAVILVSHDFRLINTVTKELWVCDHKTITQWPDADIRSYKKALAKEVAAKKFVDE